MKGNYECTRLTKLSINGSSNLLTDKSYSYKERTVMDMVILVNLMIDDPWQKALDAGEDPEVFYGE
jgi:hypothetical protein